MKADLNLLSQDYRQAATRSRHLRAWAAIVVPVALLLVVLLLMDTATRVRADEMRLASERLQDRVTGQRVEVRRLTAAVAEASLQLQRSDCLRAKRAWSGLLATIGRAMPESVWLDSIATDPDAPPAGAAKAAAPLTPTGSPAPAPVAIDAPTRLRLSGFATDAVLPVVFSENLKATAVFKAVTLERSVLEPDSKGRRFRFDMVLEW